MCSLYKIICLSGIAITLLFSSVVMAAAGVQRDQFKEIYQSIVEKMSSPSSLEEKLHFLNKKNEEYVSIIRKMKKDAKTNPSIVDSKEYISGWDIYDQIIPLLNLKLDSGKTMLTRQSCLESISLVVSREMPAPAEEDLPKLSPESETTIRIIKHLCGDSLK